MKKNELYLASTGIFYHKLLIFRNCKFSTISTFTLLMSMKRVVAIVILLSTRGTADSDNWHLHLLEKALVRSYHLLDYD